MIRVAENYLGAKLFQLPLLNRLDASLRAYRHEDRGFNRPVIRLNHTGTSFSVCGKERKVQMSYRCNRASTKNRHCIIIHGGYEQLLPATKLFYKNIARN